MVPVQPDDKYDTVLSISQAPPHPTQISYHTLQSQSKVNLGVDLQEGAISTNIIVNQLQANFIGLTELEASLTKTCATNRSSRVKKHVILQ